MQGPARRAQPAPPTTHAEPQLWPARHPFPLPTFSPLPAVVPGQEKPPMSLRQTPGSAQCARAAEGGVRRPRYTHTLVVPPHVAALFIRGQVPVPAHKLIEELGGRYHRERRAESPSPDTSSATSPRQPAPRLTETKWRRWLALPTMHRADRARRAPLPHGASVLPSPSSRVARGKNGESRQIPERESTTVACGSA